MQDNSLIKNLRNGVCKRMNNSFRNPYREVNLNWLKLKYYKHLPPGKIRKHSMFGKWLYFQRPTELLHGLREIFIDNLYKQLLPKDPFIIDCGANIGLSIIYMKRLYPGARIVAFEPDKDNYELLRLNVESFGFKDVELRKEAVWTEDTILNFTNEASMSSRIENSLTADTVKVDAIRLRDQIVRKVDFLKMDIEGAEFAVLSDLGEKLDMISNLFIEYHGTYGQVAELTSLFTIITQSGFSYYIKEAAEIYKTPFIREKNPQIPFDVQLNIFCFREDRTIN